MKKLASSKFRLDSRKLLSAQLVALANGKKTKITSDELVIDYIKSIKELNLKNDEVSITFLKELSMLVLDKRFPILMSVQWFSKILFSHKKHFAYEKMMPVLIIPFSFYKKMTEIRNMVILEYPSLIIDDRVWEVIFTQVDQLRESIPQKIKLYQKKFDIIESNLFSEFHRMSTYYFATFIKVLESINVQSTQMFSLIFNVLHQSRIEEHIPEIEKQENCLSFFSMIEEISNLYYGEFNLVECSILLNNWVDKSTFESFLIELYPWQKNKDNYLQNDYDYFSRWVIFWNINIKKDNAQNILKKLNYLDSKQLQISCFDEHCFDVFSSGQNVKNYNSDQFYFTKSMAHQFHNFDQFHSYGTIKLTIPGHTPPKEIQYRYSDIDEFGQFPYECYSYNSYAYYDDFEYYDYSNFDKWRYHSFSEIHTYCAMETIVAEPLKSVLIDCSYRLPGTEKHHVLAFMELVKKMNQWKFASLDRNDQNEILGYISHGFQDIQDFSLKGTTLKSIKRRTDMYYAEIRRQQDFFNTNSFKKYRKWEGLDEKDFYFKEQNKKYKIIQLKTLVELSDEGNYLCHCVSGYSARCVIENTSIWSMRHDGERMVTIELNGREIVQVKGKYNRNANELEKMIIGEWEKKLSMNSGKQ